MELNEFITVTLTQIVSGINEANKKFEENGLNAAANPANVYPMKEDYNSQLYGHIQPINQNRAVHKIDFDVAVTAAEGKETKGGIGVMVATVALGTQGKSQNEQSSESRIKFSVPLMYPIKNVSQQERP